MNPVPVSVIGGYLGAGKTTLVNRWLREAHARGLRLAVLVNDFGEIGIDADLIVARRDDVIELAGGCVCCSVGGDLVAALERLRARTPAPDRILLETSGVALPGTVAATARLAEGVAVDPVLVLADATTVRARADDTYVGDTVLRQLARAERLLLSRVDLADAAALAGLRAWLAALIPSVPVGIAADEPLPTVAGLAGAAESGSAGPQASAAAQADASGPAIAEPGERTARVAGGLAGSAPLAGATAARLAFESVSARFDDPVDLPGLAHDLGDPGLGLERAKGIVGGPGDRPWSIELAGGSVQVSPLAAPIDGAPRDEGLAAGRIVFIGSRARIDRSALRSLIARHGGVVAGDVVAGDVLTGDAVAGSEGAG
jgi:G3E family GTPase